MSIQVKQQETGNLVVDLLINDPKDKRSDIGRIIIDSLDVSSIVQLSRVSRGLNARAKHRWFVLDYSAIIFKYIQQGTGYRDYLKAGGWKDFLIVGAKAAGVAVTIGSAKKAIEHSKLIPPDAPTKTIIIDTEYGPREVTFIDHPEAQLANQWRFGAVVVGTVTATSIVRHALSAYEDSLILESFFSPVERDMLSQVKTPLAVTIFSHDYANWKKDKMKVNLRANPSHWQQYPQLCNMRCPLSGSFILFPVKDKCGHYFDYRSVRARQLNPAVQNPLECPISSKKPNIGLSQLVFDKARFDLIQEVLRTPPPPPNLNQVVVV
jgi:hypothetical protein